MIQKTNITLILTHTKQTRNVSSFTQSLWKFVNDQKSRDQKNDHMIMKKSCDTDHMILS